jgi:hypothetical protein
MSRPVALNCPHCGGAVGPPVGSRRTACPFCAKPLYYAGEDFLPRFVIRSVLGDDDIQERCRELFRNRVVPTHLSRRATLLKRRRSYLPFYLLTGKRGGVLAVGKERIVATSTYDNVIDRMAARSGDPDVVGMVRPSPTKVVTEEDTRVVLGDYRFLYSASTLSDWDLQDTDLRDTVLSHLEGARPARIGDLVRDGDVVDVDIPLERVITRGVAPGEMEGKWVAGTLPFRRDWALMVGLPLVGLLGFLVGNAAAGFFKVSLGEWIRNPGTFRIFLVAAALGAGFVVMGLQAAWVLVRTPFVVRVHSGGLRVEGAAEAPPSPIQPLDTAYRALFRWLFEAPRGGGYSP